jgi:hypothetical protein
MFGGSEHGESGSMRTATTLVTLVVVVPLAGCFSLFNPWSGVGSKKQDPNLGTIDGQVFKTGTATYAKWDTTLDVAPTILHENQRGDRWQISNNQNDAKDGIARKGFVFIIRKKHPNEQLAGFIVDEWHPQQQDVNSIQDTEWMGMKGVKNDNKFNNLLGEMIQFAGESGNCFYALNVYTMDKKYGDYKMLADLAMQSIHGSAGGLPSPPQCK